MFTSLTNAPRKSGIYSGVLHKNAMVYVVPNLIGGGSATNLSISTHYHHGSWVPETDMLNARSNAAAVSIEQWARLWDSEWVFTIYAYLTYIVHVTAIYANWSAIWEELVYLWISIFMYSFLQEVLLLPYFHD